MNVAAEFRVSMGRRVGNTISNLSELIINPKYFECLFVTLYRLTLTPTMSLEFLYIRGEYMSSYVTLYSVYNPEG